MRESADDENGFSHGSSFYVREDRTSTRVAGRRPHSQRAARLRIANRGLATPPPPGRDARHSRHGSARIELGFSRPDIGTRIETDSTDSHGSDNTLRERCWTGTTRVGVMAHETAALEPDILTADSRRARRSERAPEYVSLRLCPAARRRRARARRPGATNARVRSADRQDQRAGAARPPGASHLCPICVISRSPAADILRSEEHAFAIKRRASPDLRSISPSVPLPTPIFIAKADGHVLCVLRGVAVQTGAGAEAEAGAEKATRGAGTGAPWISVRGRWSRLLDVEALQLDRDRGVEPDVVHVRLAAAVGEQVEVRDVDVAGLGPRQGPSNMTSL